ncbi:hypothetical protein DERP_006096 [Dermatophagoides pteronyssinus]|uniref:Ectonucleotide pyrophosphatase/phosphodiesterase family member 5-like n=1 Tax=Dermatophagoides pteronyssinus TaxID=6956 RepID=A0ABQ8JSA8_DERPT|nr:hypothetical protein DERP_006096 [Dermatophagoides pteronyssinus]
MIIPTYEMINISKKHHQRHNHFKLVVFSFDGFRPDYITVERTPNLYDIAKNGVQGIMRSTFVTKTFPNHQSIVTGLYEPYHGIVNNKFIDPLTKQPFSVNNDSWFWWDQHNISVPIYIANQYYESNRYSISLQWPGSISNYTDGYHLDHRERVHYLENYQSNVDFFHLIDVLMKWLTDPIKPANLAFVYFQQPDETAHQYGPFSDEVYEQVQLIDKVVGYFQQQLLKMNLAHLTNVIYLSDHGMSEIRSERSLYIDKCDKYYPGLKYELYGSSPTWSAIPISAPKLSSQKSSELAKSVRDALNDCSHKYYNGKFSVYLQEEIADEFHYKNNIRILPLFIISEEGYDINYKDVGYRPKGYPIWGNHGYNSSLPSMQPLFLAKGPRFKTSYSHPIPFENIDLYPLMLNLLDIPLKHFPTTNGTFEHVHQMLIYQLYLNDDKFTMSLNVFFYLISGFMIIFLAGFCFVCISGRIEKNYLRNSIDSSSSSSTSKRLINYLKKISNGQQNEQRYRMFANERPTSHLDSSDDDDDNNGEDELFNRNRHQQKAINKNQLTDIDWDILGTGLDIDLVGQLKNETSNGQNIVKRNEYLDISSDNTSDNNDNVDRPSSKSKRKNEIISLLITDDDDDDCNNMNDKEIKIKINNEEFENLISETNVITNNNNKVIENDNDKLIDI